MNQCNKPHKNKPAFNKLPNDQGQSRGRHRCCGCAYEQGFAIGRQRKLNVSFDYEQLPYNQAGTGRHKSVHAAFALGYSDGVQASYQK